MKKILIMVGGGTKHVLPFKSAADELGLDVELGSFKDLEYVPDNGGLRVLVRGRKVNSFDVIYLRLVGKRYEDAALLVYSAVRLGVKIIDSIYEKKGMVRLPLPKSIEAKLLIEAGIPIPKTYFMRTTEMKTKVVADLGYPFVIKGTTGKQGNAVWSPRNESELDELIEKFTPLERKSAARFIAQEFIRSGQRIRVFVVGEKVVAAITRPMRWRKRFIKRVDGEFPPGERKMLHPIPEADARLAVDASRAVGVNVGGVDILTDDQTGKKYVIEVNSAPGWKSIKADTGINVEKEILLYLASL
jgi:RimK family alpha-L-glutamate ligase